MAKTNQTPAVAQAMKKIDIAKKLYAEITAVPAPEGKTHRGIFIERAMAQIGMSKSGANTYFQNLKNEAHGEGRYKYQPKSPAKAAEAGAAAAQPQPRDTAEELHKLQTEVHRLSRSVNKLLKQNEQRAA